MSEANSTSTPAPGKTPKPNKPYPDFPLFHTQLRVGLTQCGIPGALHTKSRFAT